LPESSRKQAINRIIDANLNRAKEGLRVCEEITRFLLDDRILTADLKDIRHKIDIVVRALPGSFFDLLRARRSLGDVGKEIYGSELIRKDMRDVFFANLQRVKESIRVLEEFSKLGDTRSAVRFKRIRYEVYELEHKAGRKVK